MICREKVGKLINQFCQFLGVFSRMGDGKIDFGDLAENWGFKKKIPT